MNWDDVEPSKVAWSHDGGKTWNELPVEWVNGVHGPYLNVADTLHLPPPSFTATIEVRLNGALEQQIAAAVVRARLLEILREIWGV